jgi:four helix bundle protein
MLVTRRRNPEFPGRAIGSGGASPLVRVCCEIGCPFVLVHVLVLVLEICHNGVQSIVYNIIFCYYSKWSQSLTTKKLDVYGLELQFVAWTTDFLLEVSQSPVSHRRELLDQLDRACISVLLNSAEGNEKRQGLQRATFFDDARGSALECAACLDASVAKRITKSDRIRPGKGY